MSDTPRTDAYGETEMMSRPLTCSDEEWKHFYTVLQGWAALCRQLESELAARPEERTLGGWPLVKRYSQLGSGMVSTFEGPNRIPSGDWVAASDYDRLLQLAVDLEYRATNAEAASSPQKE